MSSRKPAVYVLIPIAVFIVLELISLLLIKSDGIIQNYKMTEHLRTAQIFFWEKGEKIRNYFHLEELNESLAAENARLNAELEFYKNAVTPQGISYSSSYSGYFLPAKVLYNSVSHKNNYMIVNRGSIDGVEEGMGVITPNGIAGLIVQVSERYSKISSFISQESAVGAIIARNKTFGTLRWEGKQTDIAKLEDIPVHTEVQVGDTIKSSGYSIKYPSDIPLGTIISREIINGVDYQIKVKLFENYRALDYVYIVNLAKAKDIDPLINEATHRNER